MIRKLLIVFASGLVLSVLLLSAAWVIGGKALVDRVNTDYGGWNIVRHHDHGDRGGDRQGPRTTRTLTFDGSKLLTVDAPVELRFTRGDETRMTVEGPARIVDRLHWQDGRLSLGGRGRWRDRPITLAITAPQLAGLVLHGASDVDLAGLDQPALTIEAHGAVDLQASGKVQTLTASTHGAGDLDFERLDVTDATVRVAGVGDVDLNASGKVDAAISGAGDIGLHRKPAALISSVSGIGRIEEDY